MFVVAEPDIVGHFDQRRHVVGVGSGAVFLDVGTGGHLDGSHHVVELVAAAALRLAWTSTERVSTHVSERGKCNKLLYRKRELVAGCKRGCISAWGTW